MAATVNHYQLLLGVGNAFRYSTAFALTADVWQHVASITVHYKVEASNVLEPLSGSLYLPSQEDTTGSTSGGGSNWTHSLGSDGALTPGAVPQAALRSIFGSSSGGALTCTNPLFFTFIAFVATLIYVLVVRVIRQRQNHTMCTYEGVPLWRSLLLQHAWCSLFVPCHSRCAIIHAVLPLNHTLTLLLLATAMVSMVSASQSGAVWLVACITTLLAQTVRPLLQYYYSAWRFDTVSYELERHHREEARRQQHATRMKETLHGGGSAATRQKDLVPESSLVALDDIELVDDDDDDDDDGGGVLETIDEDTENVDVDFGLPEEEDRNESCTEVMTKDELTAMQQDSSEGHALEQMEEENEGEVMAAVICEKFVTRGHVVNAVYALLCTGIIFTLMSQLMVSVDSCSLLLDSFSYAILIDVLATQTAVVGLVYTYRWMTASAAGDEEGVDCVWSELHPREGEQRPYVSAPSS